MTDAELLDQLIWESLHVDFTGPKHRMTTADWAAWDGYEPHDSGRAQPKLRKGKPRTADRHTTEFWWRPLPPVLARIRDEQARP